MLTMKVKKTGYKFCNNVEISWVIYQLPIISNLLHKPKPGIARFQLTERLQEENKEEFMRLLTK